MKKDVLILLFFVWIPASLYSVYGWHQMQERQVVDLDQLTGEPVKTYLLKNITLTASDTATFSCTVKKFTRNRNADV